MAVVHAPNSMLHYQSHPFFLELLTLDRLLGNCLDPPQQFGHPTSHILRLCLYKTGLRSGRTVDILILKKQRQDPYNVYPAPTLRRMPALVQDLTLA